MKNRGWKILGLLTLAGATLLAEEPARGATKTAPRVWVADRMAVCVYCGASDAPAPKYAELATALGAGLAQRGWTLVWGGARTGLMGAVARGAREAGGRTVGVIPEFIARWEVSDPRADELTTVPTMAERKQQLQSRADAFVVLPGGIGTLDEIADTLDLRNLSQHRKPIIVLNQDGYYDALLAWVDRTVAEGFAKPEVRRHLRVTGTLDETLEALAEFERAAANGRH